MCEEPESRALLAPAGSAAAMLLGRPDYSGVRLQVRDV